MTIFKTRGFDSIIGKGMSVFGEIILDRNSTLVIEGHAEVSRVSTAVNSNGNVDTKTTLRVSGELKGAANCKIEVHNVIITGKVVCEEVRVEGTLAVKSGSTLIANKIFYRELIVETGAIMNGQMLHLDHVSEGEKT